MSMMTIASDTPLFDFLASRADAGLPVVESWSGLDEPRARRSDPVTSHMAADSISGEAREASELFVLQTVKRMSPLTDADIHDLAVIGGNHWSESRLRTARKQLVDKGLIVCVDREGRTDSGRSASRWAAA